MTDRITGLNIGNEAGKETDTFEEVPNASKVDMLSAIIEAVKSTNRAFNSANSAVQGLNRFTLVVHRFTNSSRPLIGQLLTPQQ